MLGLPGWLVGGIFAVGVALMLSGVSIGSWRGSEEGLTLRKMLASPTVQVPLWVGLALVGAAVAVGSESIWGAGSGLLLAGLSAFEVFIEARKLYALRAEGSQRTARAGTAETPQEVKNGT